jgi:hypothetical protein
MHERGIVDNVALKLEKTGYVAGFSVVALMLLGFSAQVFVNILAASGIAVVGGEIVRNTK